MKSYSVKEVADLLNTNPETVRRWIRDKKLDSSFASKKTGHIISESALQSFLDATPKYASVATTLASTAILSSVVVGGIIAQQLIDIDKIKKAMVSEKDLLAFLQSEIQRSEDAIQSKRATISQIEKEITEEELKIQEICGLITELKNKEVASSE